MGINLKKLITDKGLNKVRLAKELYPENQHPSSALKRVLIGEAMLDEEQISRLSLLTNTSINALFSGDWKVRNKKNIVYFENELFHGELDRDTWLAKFFSKSDIEHHRILLAKAVTLKEFIDKLYSLST